MSASGSESPKKSEDWQQQESRATGPTRIRLYLWRLVMSLIFICFLWALFYFVLLPFLRPNTHLAVLRRRPANSARTAFGRRRQ